jgi:hypothetical protein
MEKKFGEFAASPIACGVDEGSFAKSIKVYGLILGSCGSFFEQLFLAIDHGIDVGRGELKSMAVGDGISGTGFHAIAAEDATRVINIVYAGVPLTRGDSLCVRVFRSFDVDTTSGAGGGAQETADTLFQSVFISMEDVNAPITRLEMDGFFGVIFGDRFPQHVAEGHPEAFYERDKCFASFLEDGRHRNSV